MDMKMKKYRIFVSIDIPEEVKNVAEAHIEGFYKNNLARVGEKENWHITVVFCEYLDEEKLKKLKEISKKIVSETNKFEITPDKIIFKNNRMAWLTFKQSPEFSNLSKRFNEFSHHARQSLPHLTLVRFDQKYYPELKKLLPENGIGLEKETKPFIVEAINIMESHLSPLGPKYELLCRNCLK
jgi:2'-5' RNA ligase